MAAAFMATAAMAQEDAVTIQPPELYEPLELAVCKVGLEMLQTDYGALSDYDGEPLTHDDIAEINRSGEVLVQQYCGPLV